MQKKTTIRFILSPRTLIIAVALFGISHATASATDLTHKLKEIKSEIKTTKKLQSVKEKQVAIIQKQLQSLTSETTALEEKIKSSEEELKEMENAIARIRSGIAEQGRALSGQKKVLSQLIRSQYETGTESPMSRLFFSGGTPLSTSDYLTQTQSKIHATITRINKLRRKMIADRTVLEKKKDEAENTKKKLEKRNEALESARINKAYLASKTQKDIQAFSQKISQLQQEENAIRREIERIELAKLDGVNFANLPSKKDADLSYPVKNIRISQYYGRTDFSRGAYRSGLHNGIDLAGSGNILAAADGKVIATGNMGRYGYGRWAAIDHGNGLVTLYGHMRKVKVKRGEKLKKGDRVGIMGSTGYSTGVHVHFSIFASSSFEVVRSSKVSGLKVPTGASIDPMDYL